MLTTKKALLSRVSKSVIIMFVFVASTLIFMAIRELRVWIDQNHNCMNGKQPLKDYLVVTNSNQQEFLIELSRRFASEHGFRFDIVYYTSNQNEFLVDLIRKDVEIIITNSFSQGEYEVSFYNNDCVHPTSASDIEGLATYLKRLISEIPSVRITEKK